MVFSIHSKRSDLFFVGAGIFLEASALLLLHFGHRYDLAFWMCLIALGLSAIPFFLHRAHTTESFMEGRDFLVILGLIGFSLPLYLFMNDWLPFQIGPDESVIWELTQTANTRPLLGCSGFASFPNLGFLVFAKIAQLLGQITIPNLRIINGVIGILIVCSLYAFYRTGWRALPSACATLIVGFNHALLAHSRLCYHANIDVLIETLAFVCFVRAFQTTNYWLAYLAGLIAGSAYYFYYPARSVIFIWGITVVFAALTWHRNSRAHLIKLFVASAFVFLLTALPQMVASIDYPSDYMNKQLLITKEGMQMYMQRRDLTDERSAFIWNMYYQLSSFNTPNPDAWSLYFNPNSAFCDAVTGGLLWVGLLLSVVTRVKDEREKWLRGLSLIGFGALMFVYAFIINCAPTYSRLLIMLPFIGYFAQVAINFVSKTTESLLARKPQIAKILPKVIVASITLAIVIGNLSITRGWFVFGLNYGDRWGGVMHYINRRRKMPDYKWYMVTKSEGDSSFDCFFPWTSATACKHLLCLFVGHETDVHVIEPKQFCDELAKNRLDGEPIRPPLTIFLVRKCCPCLETLVRNHPKLLMHDIASEGRYQAIELFKEGAPESY